MSFLETNAEQGWIQIQNLTDAFWPKFAIVISAIKTNKNRKKNR